MGGETLGEERRHGRQARRSRETHVVLKMWNERESVTRDLVEWGARSRGVDFGFGAVHTASIARPLCPLYTVSFYAASRRLAGCVPGSVPRIRTPPA